MRGVSTKSTEIRGYNFQIFEVFLPFIFNQRLFICRSSI